MLNKTRWDLVTQILGCLSSHEINLAAGSMNQEDAKALEQILRIPRTTLEHCSTIQTVLQRRLEKQSTHQQFCALQMITWAVHEGIIAAIGANWRDPSLEELRLAVNQTLEECDTTLVALALALNASTNAPAADKCHLILSTDERFALEVLRESCTDQVQQKTPKKSRSSPSAVVLAKRTARREAKRAPRAAQTAVTRYRKSPSIPDIKSHGTTPREVETESGSSSFEGPSLTTRRTVNPVMRFNDLDLNDPLVGKIVRAPIKFRGPIQGIKRRPCVVIAASGCDFLILRPCYSAGGFACHTWKTSSITVLEGTGLTKEGGISNEEYRVERRRVSAPIGSLSTVDWNQL